MKLKQKIWASNLLVFIVPLVITLIIGRIAFHFMYAAYWDPIEKMFEDRNELLYAQSLIYSNQDILTNSSAQYAKKQDRHLSRLVTELDSIGYHLAYRFNGKEVFSNLTTEDNGVADNLLGGRFTGLKHVTTSEDGKSIIKITWARDTDTVVLIAINRGTVISGYIFTAFTEYIVSFILLLLTLVFGSIVVVNLLLHRQVKRTLLEPLEQLSEATRSIRAGQLETLISYHGIDELGQVCDDFRAMQSYLKQSVVDRLRYEQQRKELLAGISHDLRTPLTSIKGYTEGLQTGIANTVEKQQRYYQAIITRSSDLERLIDDLSLYNQLETHQLICQFRRCDLVDFLQRYIQEEKDSLAQQQVIVEINCNCDFCEVQLDEHEFRRVLQNLFSNTVKYRQKKSSNVIISVERVGKSVLVSFHDDGPGVPDFFLPRIFEAFYRVDDARTHFEYGSGLGLAVVQQIVKAHKGTVVAKNKQGLTIEIRLPDYLERKES